MPECPLARPWCVPLSGYLSYQWDKDISVNESWLTACKGTDTRGILGRPRALIHVLCSQDWEEMKVKKWFKFHGYAREGGHRGGGGLDL